MGRPRKSLARKIAEGDAAKKGMRKLAEAVKNHVKTARDLPPCPSDLTPDQREAWNYMATELGELQMDFGAADALTLRGASTAVGNAVAVRREINKCKDVRLRAKLELQERKSWELYLKFADRICGLHPLGRERVSVVKSGVSDLASILNAPEEEKVQ